MSQKPNAEALFATAGGTAANTSLGTLAIVPPKSSIFIEGIYARPVVAGAANSTVTISDSASVGTPVDSGLVAACSGTASVIAESSRGRVINNTHATNAMKLVVCTGAVAPAQVVDVVVKYSLVPLT